MVQPNYTQVLPQVKMAQVEPVYEPDYLYLAEYAELVQALASNLAQYARCTLALEAMGGADAVRAELRSRVVKHGR